MSSPTAVTEAVRCQRATIAPITSWSTHHPCTVDRAGGQWDSRRPGHGTPEKHDSEQPLTAESIGAAEVTPVRASSRTARRA